ncbi:MAG: hypothetical protein RXP97_00930 [Nitrososphaeria archaeon]
MQDKTALRHCDDRELDPVRSLVMCHASRGIIGLELLCAGGGPCTEVFALEPSASAEAVSRRPFLAGVHVSRICRGRIEPLMGLLSALWGYIDRGYIVVDERAEALFLYGRDVFPGSVVRYSRSQCGTYVVLNRRWEPLGWARREGRLYRHVLDAGWYLRSGL